MQRASLWASIVVLTSTFAVPAGAGTLKCPPDSVKVGTACVDRYEESVWQIPPSNTALVKKVAAGKVTLAELTGGGATQLAPAGTCSGSSDYGMGFPNTGNWLPVAGSNPPSPGVYAVSVAGVRPSACISWFQANQACALSGKRLLRNGEWQRAAAGTPDPGSAPGSMDCNTSSTGPSDTGSRTNCVSVWGVFDMVGNTEEWVEDWGEVANDCTNWPAAFGDDVSCIGGPGYGYSNFPTGLARGGTWVDGSNAGVFAVASTVPPSLEGPGVGFRCAR
jgi:Sulfatase-modifying factor enzyme 1